MPGDFSGFGGLVRSTDLVDRDGPPVSLHDERRLVEDVRGCTCRDDGHGGEPGRTNAGCPATHLSVWVRITQAERRRYIQMIPKGWPKVVLDREAGLSVPELAQKYRMETEVMRDGLALAYGWVEQRIQALAAYRAGVR